MKFASALTILFFAVLSTLSLVAAVPVTARDIFDPTITSPKAGDVWVVGQTVEVTWDTSNAPVDISNASSVWLRKGTSTLLAQGFDLRSGSVSVVVPSLVPGDDYHIILFGDSGNVSPAFSIVSPAGAASA
ncbi:hypothetical protein BD779DRAFT_1440189 [Infundibulicybe gibba]|nr:hypothetical protein BD779DRAFT_1440189 [Infundibulicybe gibba]